MGKWGFQDDKSLINEVSSNYTLSGLSDYDVRS